ncbi:MAG: methyl-accepting chemotaxis protein [Proteobacteria bacterium]|nr:methyl-accepting chemotaxis protein [Pseudomonadota bacterium]
MFKLNRLSLVRQITLAGTLVSLAVFAVLIGFTSHFTREASLAKTDEELSHQIEGIIQMLELSHDSAVAHARKGLDRVKDSLGPLKVGPETQTQGSYQLPVVHSGERLVNGNTALLEALRKQTDADPALLLRSGDELVRAATLLKTKDGKSTEGTAIPAGSPEAKALLAGKPYAGVVKRSGKYYVSAIEPLMDGSGKVIGALAARVSIQQDMDRLMQAVASIKSGQTGYAYILTNESDPTKAEFIYHPTLTGKTIGELAQPTLIKIAEEQISKKSGQLTYAWPHTPGGSDLDDKIIVYRSSPSWGWVVSTGSFIDEFTVEARKLRDTLIALCLGGALILAGTLYAITRNRLAPIKNMLESSRRMGEGDLTVRFPDAPANSANELDQIANALGNTVGKIGQLIGDVIQTTSTVKNAAREVRLGSDQVVNSTTAQSEAAAGLAAAIEELSVSITQVSDSAAVARDFTQQAQGHADDGSDKVRIVISGMDRIASEIGKAGEAVNLLSERSARISNIGKIINEIADQTNLLALNAAIEAARAGESGRGFAVVADEVRKLAENTGKATSQISGLITGIQSEVDVAVTRMQAANEKAGFTRDRVVASTSALDAASADTGQVSESVRLIAEAVREQDTAVQQVARSIEQIAQMTDENSASARSAAETAHQLDEMAGTLRAAVNQFKV